MIFPRHTGGAILRWALELILSLRASRRHWVIWERRSKHVHSTRGLQRCMSEALQRAREASRRPACRVARGRLIAPAAAARASCALPLSRAAAVAGGGIAPARARTRSSVAARWQRRRGRVFFYAKEACVRERAWRSPRTL